MIAPSLGLVLGSEIPPEQLPTMVVDAELAGFGEVWLSEDCFFSGGISGAAIALSATRRIPVGLGVVSALTRHPALLAMEIATLDRTFPDRLMPAVGLGVPFWLGQMGLKPSSALGTVRDCLTVLDDLLSGREATSNGTFTAEGIRLAHPPTRRIPLQTGVAGPKMLQLSGELADGTLLSVLAGAGYVRWARDQIDAGRARGGATHPHRVTTFALCAVDEDSEVAKADARDAVAFYLAAGGANALTDAYGISDELRALLADGGPGGLAECMPDKWVDDLAVAGDPDECSRKIQTLLDAGSDHVALFPTPAENAQRTASALATHVLPRFAESSPSQERPNDG
jgi:alkanesulfonate monooxygenase SsuD/methylene tetrahydromethanopterin reductase-like flavin-dependent oxidoreductase (luciferase family)